MEFDQAGYGRDKGIPSILLAASGLNSVFAIVGYGTVFSILFASDTAAWVPAVLGFVEVFGFGVLGGVIVACLVLVGWSACGVQKRFALLVLGATAVIQLGKKIGMSGGGALAALSMAAFASHRLRVWGRETDAKEVATLFGVIWTAVGQVRSPPSPP